MCGGCWTEALEEFSEPAPVTEGVTAAVEAIRALYKVHPVGGELHAVVDDWNTEDDSVHWCGDDPATGRHPDALDATERTCWDALVALTEIERCTALAIHSGYYDPAEQEATTT